MFVKFWNTKIFHCIIYHIILFLFCIFIPWILVSSPPLLVTRTVKISNTFFTTTPQVDNSTINVTWYPPNTPNGAIMRYSINVTSTGRNTIMRHINNAGNVSFTELIRDLSKFMYLWLILKIMWYVCILGPGVPYNVSLAAYNELGRGMPVKVTVFTQVLGRHLNFVY